MLLPISWEIKTDPFKMPHILPIISQEGDTFTTPKNYIEIVHKANNETYSGDSCQDRVVGRREEREGDKTDFETF